MIDFILDGYETQIHLRIDPSINLGGYMTAMMAFKKCKHFCRMYTFSRCCRCRKEYAFCVICGVRE